MAASTTLSCPLPTPTTLPTLTGPRSTAPHSVSLAPLPPPQPTGVRSLQKSIAYCHKLSRNVVTSAVGETLTPAGSTTEEIVAPTEPCTEEMPTSEEQTVGEILPRAELTIETSTELPEIVKNLLEAWDKIDDKYAVSSLAVAGLVGLCGAAGFVSAIDKIPLLPGVLEVVGIGYSGWFAYKNLVFKSNRDVLLSKIKCTYKDITGSSS